MKLQYLSGGCYNTYFETKGSGGNDSENSGSGLNGKRFFGSPGWKIPRKSGT